jgi:aryl-alcohol dehydrogenase-like predicted oxidoreductase
VRNSASASFCLVLWAGFLTGKINENTNFDSSDFRSVVPRFSPEAIKANMALVDLLREVGAAKGATPAQLALAWLLARKPWIVPIPGTTKLHRLEENLGSLAVELTAINLQPIKEATSKIALEGARLPESALKMTGRCSPGCRECGGTLRNVKQPCWSSGFAVERY